MASLYNLVQNFASLDGISVSSSLMIRPVSIRYSASAEICQMPVPDVPDVLLDSRADVPPGLADVYLPTAA